jgi:hypothetical protein
MFYCLALFFENKTWSGHVSRFIDCYYRSDFLLSILSSPFVGILNDAVLYILHVARQSERGNPLYFGMDELYFRSTYEWSIYS